MYSCRSYTPFDAGSPQSSDDEWINFFTGSDPIDQNCDDYDPGSYVDLKSARERLSMCPPHPQKVPANRERAATYAKRAVHHFNSIEDTQFEFTELVSFHLEDTGTWSITFYADEPEKGTIATRFFAEVAEDEVHSCTVCAPNEVLSQFQAKHAISKYNKEKGAAYEVAEILQFHGRVILGSKRRGYWSHINFTAVSKSCSDKSPVLFFAEVNDDEEIGCCIVEHQDPGTTYECEICPPHENVCHPFKSPVGGLVRGPAFAAYHFDGSDIIRCCT